MKLPYISSLVGYNGTKTGKQCQTGLELLTLWLARKNSQAISDVVNLHFDDYLQVANKLVNGHKSAHTIKRIDKSSVSRINIRTGEAKTIKMATDKQLKYIRNMHEQLGHKQPKYTNLTIWQASKIINKLKYQLDNQSQQAQKMHREMDQMMLPAIMRDK